VAIIYAAIGLLVNTISVFSVKVLSQEEQSPYEKQQEPQEEKYGLITAFRLLASNKYYLMICGVYILQQLYGAMINAGIFDGDTILVEQRQTARNGDMVVALVDDSATVKTFYQEADHIRLQPENDSMEPIIVPDCQILGKVFGVMRFFK